MRRGVAVVIVLSGLSPGEAGPLGKKEKLDFSRVPKTVSWAPI